MHHHERKTIGITALVRRCLNPLEAFKSLHTEAYLLATLSRLYIVQFSFMFYYVGPNCCLCLGRVNCWSVGTLSLYLGQWAPFWSFVGALFPGFMLLLWRTWSTMIVIMTPVYVSQSWWRTAGWSMSLWHLSMCHSRGGELLDEVCHYDTCLCVTVVVENCWMKYVIMTPVYVSQSWWRTAGWSMSLWHQSMCHTRCGELLDEVCHYDTSLCVTVVVENCWMKYVIMTPVYVSQSSWRTAGWSMSLWHQSMCHSRRGELLDEVCHYDTSLCVTVVVAVCWMKYVIMTPVYASQSSWVLLDEVCHYDTSLCVTVVVKNCWMKYVIMTPVYVSQSLWRTAGWSM